MDILQLETTIANILAWYYSYDGKELRPIVFKINLLQELVLNKILLSQTFRKHNQANFCLPKESSKYFKSNLKGFVRICLTIVWETPQSNPFLKEQ